MVKFRFEGTTLTDGKASLVKLFASANLAMLLVAGPAQANIQTNTIDVLPEPSSIVSKAADIDLWLSQSKGKNHTIQLATIYGEDKCQAFVDAFTGQQAYCLQSTEHANRWFVLTGAYSSKSAASDAAIALGVEEPYINYLPRVARTRCDLEQGSTQFPIICGGQEPEGFAHPPRADKHENQASVDPALRPAPKSVYAAAAQGSDAHGKEHDDAHGESDDHGGGHGKHIPRLSDVPTPYLTEKELGTRTAPLIEWGGDFLGTGNINRGFVMPGGAVWTPQFWVYGTGRSALQNFERPGDTGSTSEWVNRLDLFGNLQLSGTERLLIGISPLNRGGSFTGSTISSPTFEEGSFDEFNADLRTFFFEGDLAEIFPKWDAADGKKNDIGFSVGRQGVLFQDGMTLNDTLDAVGFSKNNLRFEGVPWLVNWRSSVLFAWNEVNREDNSEDESAELYGWFNQWDTLKSTIDLDLIYVDSELENADQFVASINFIQRFGKIGSTLRIAHSQALDEESAVAGDGTLLFGEFNYVPAYTHDNMYVNAFAAFDHYTSASRDPLAGGPLGRVGLLYAASGLGRYPSPLNNRANDAFGFSAGYQRIDDKNRRQWTIEVGARENDLDSTSEYGLAGRFQQALGKRFVLQIDGFVADRDNFDANYGARLELLFKL